MRNKLGHQENRLAKFIMLKTTTTTTRTVIGTAQLNPFSCAKKDNILNKSFSTVLYIMVRNFYQPTSGLAFEASE